MSTSITNTPLAPPAEPQRTPLALANKALTAAQDRGLPPDAAMNAARATIWRARWRSVLAGDTTMGDVWLEALALLGDRGGKRAVADRAQADAKGGRA